MKLWAILARYALRSGEFQVRLPLHDAARARAAVEMSGYRGRVEGGTAVWGGREAGWVLQLEILAPQELCWAAWEVVNAVPDRRREKWAAFSVTLDDLLRKARRLPAR